jgi:hypothetical protein
MIAAGTDHEFLVTDDHIMLRYTRPAPAGRWSSSQAAAAQWTGAATPPAEDTRAVTCDQRGHGDFQTSRSGWTVQARHRRDRADRFAAIGYDSVFRLKPFSPTSQWAPFLRHRSARHRNPRPSHLTSQQRTVRHYPRLQPRTPLGGRSDWIFTSQLSAPPFCTLLSRGEICDNAIKSGFT